MPETTLSELFLKTASYNKPDHLMQKVGGTYQPISTAEFVDRVRRLAKALSGLGVKRGDRVALMADNGPHWPTDFASLSIGAATVPIYPTLLPEQAAYIAPTAAPGWWFVHRREQLEGLLARAGRCRGSSGSC
jgi:long-chain acyl-CoA synthetase